MPIDAAIPLAAQGVPQLVNPMQVYAQAQQMQLAREQQRALEEQRQSLAAERAQQTAKLAQQNADAQAFADSIRQGNGVRAATMDYATKNHPGLVPKLQEYFDKADESADKIKKSQAELKNMQLDHIGHTADWLLTHASDPAMLPGAIGMALAHHAELFPDEAQQVQQLGAQLHGMSPEQQKQFLEQTRATAPYYQGEQAKLAEKGPTIVPEGGTAIGPTGQVLFKGGEKPPTEAELDARYQSLFQKQALKQPLTAAEQAEMTSYQQRKLLGPEAAAALASNRQTRAIEAQMAQQGRAQNFAEQQAGRSELTNKVEQPYLDAKEKAATLRSVIEAAKQGNMAAANVQTLLGTLGLVTMEGVKRINTTELQQVGGAGSLLERLKGSVGGLVAGKPLSPKIQSDLQELSNMLEQSATDKYTQGWKATTKRYNLTDEQPLVPIAQAGTASKPPANESLEHRVWRVGGKVGPEPK